MLYLSPRREDLDAIEVASRDEIAALQLKRLKWTLRHVDDNVPHYWKKFDQAGVHPDDLNSLDDLAKFPFTVKEDLRVNYPFGLFAVPAEKSYAPTPLRAQRANRPWWATPGAISTHGPTWWRARSARPAVGRACVCIYRTATACSPVASVRTTAPSGSAA